MSKTDQTAGATFDSLTGHDEMSITQHFGTNIGALTDDSSMWARALVFTMLRREGADDDAARTVALDMRLAEVTDYFAEDAEEAAEKTESGKGEPESGLPKVAEKPSPSSLSSVS